MDAGGVGGSAQRADAMQAGRDLMLGQAQAAASSREDAKIEKAGHDFESLLLGTWLTSAEHSFAEAPGGADGEEDGDGSQDQFLGMAMQQLASTLADHGGIGIGKMIVEHLRHEGETSQEKKKG